MRISGRLFGQQLVQHSALKSGPADIRLARQRPHLPIARVRVRPQRWNEKVHLQTLAESQRNHRRASVHDDAVVEDAQRMTANERLHEKYGSESRVHFDTLLQ